MPDLPNKIKDVHERMFNAAKKAKRSPADISLIAATKSQPLETLRTLHQLGLYHFGENYVSDAMNKMPYLPDTITWHFIGPIQSNKTRFIAEHFQWVHTVDRIKIVDRLSRQRPASMPPLQCLIQVNISDESQKSGVTPDQTLSLAAAIDQADNLELQGLMAIGRQTQNTQAISEDFAKMQQLSQTLQGHYPHAKHLSMGMSADFECAITYGATFIRVGSSLVGPRRENV